MPVLQFMLIGMLGAFLATDYSNILSANARRDINKLAFYVFSPSIVFSSLAKAVTLKDLISWWFMPVNIGIIFLIGGSLGWIAVKILRPERHLEGVVIGSCSAANLGNLVLILVPAVCNEAASPFGDSALCRARGLSYVSMSMSLGNIFIWTHTYSLMRKSSILYNQKHNQNQHEISNTDSEVSSEAIVVKIDDKGSSSDQEVLVQSTMTSTDASIDEKMIPLLSSTKSNGNKLSFQDRLKGLNKVLEELFAPPTIAAIIGLIVGAIPWLKSLIIGSDAPLRVIEDSITSLGNGMLPCIILILGGNLTQGLRKSTIKPSLIVVIIIVRYIFLPIAGIAVVKAAGELGFLAEDSLYRYVLMIQFTLPPAMSIGTMAQLFDVAKEECSVIFLWTYLAALVAISIWPTVFMWILT